jgi:general secretion pathway protein E
VGCDECRHTGYMGRIGIYESLFIDKAMRKLINSSHDLQLYHDAAEKQGMRNLRISGAQKVANGLTTLEEIYSVVPPNKDD